MIVWAPLGNVIVKVLSGSPVIENPLGTGAPEQDRFGPQVILPSGLTTTVPGAHGMGDDRSKGQIAPFLAMAMLSVARAGVNHPAEIPATNPARSRKRARESVMSAACFENYLSLNV